MLQYIGIDLIITKWLSNVLKIKKMQKKSVAYSKKLENLQWIALELWNIMGWKNLKLSNYQWID